MSYAYAALKVALQAAADILGRAAQVALGSPDEVEYPTYGLSRATRDTGQMWATGESPVDLVLQGLGAEFDRAAVAWAMVKTQAAGVPPTISAQSRIANVSKDEVNDQITVTFAVPFLSSEGIVPWAFPSIVAGCPRLVGINTGQMTLEFIDPVTGLKLGINSRNIRLFAIGAV